MSEESIGSIERTPGFIVPDDKGQFMRDVNRPEYDRLESIRDGLYHTKAGIEPVAPETKPPGFIDSHSEERAGIESKVAVAPLQDQSELIAVAEAEMKLLVGLGFEESEVPLDIPEWKVQSLKLQRLTAERNYLELNPLIAEQMEVHEATPVMKSAFNAFLNITDIDKVLKENISEQIVDWIHRKNEAKHQEE